MYFDYRFIEHLKYWMPLIVVLAYVVVIGILVRSYMLPIENLNVMVGVKYML